MESQVESKAEIVLSCFPWLTSSSLCWDILCDPTSFSHFMTFFLIYILPCFPHIKLSCDFSPPPWTVVLFSCLHVSFLTGLSSRLLPCFTSYLILHSHQTIFHSYFTQKCCGDFQQTNLRSPTFSSGDFLGDF